MSSSKEGMVIGHDGPDTSPETPVVRYSVPLWRRPSRADVNILTKERDQAYEDASASWECMDMGRETVAAILGEDPKEIAPMFIPEAIRSACYRAATGTLRDEVMPPDAASRRVTVLENELRRRGHEHTCAWHVAGDPCSCGLDEILAGASRAAGKSSAEREPAASPEST